MNTIKRKIVWTCFWLSSILTWTVYTKLWMMASYTAMLCAFGLSSIFFGILIVTANRFALRPILLVVLGLICGQWWFIEQAVAIILWNINGMSP